MFLALSAPFVACASSTQGGSPFQGTAGEDTSSGGTSTAGNSGTASGDNGGDNGGGTGGGFASSGGASSGGDAGHMQKCDDAGNCTCISIASLGYEGVWGPCSGDSTSAFQSWLNSESTAHVDAYHMKPTINAAFLNQYDVIILQWMVSPVNVTTNAQGGTTGVTEGDPWTFSSDELTAIQTWVNGGGGIIALSGYNCQDNSSGCTVKDNVATNQILESFTDILINTDNTLNASPNNSSSVCQAENCYCWGASLPLGTATTTIAAPLSTTAATSMGLAVGAWDQTTPIGKNVTDIGAFNGRSIQTKSGKPVVDAKDSNSYYAVHQDIGTGHVIVYGDEWLTYTGEWTGSSTCQMWDYDSGSCAGKSAAEVFQIPQFWYNSIKYAASSVTCFTIHSSGIVY